MRVAIVHNSYGKSSGEEVVVDGLGSLLAERDHTVLHYQRSSGEIPGKWFGQIQAFAAGIYNPFSKGAFGRFLDAKHPDVVHIHNLFPFISPSILPECSKRAIPVVMTLHNFRLVCPNALLLRDGLPCHDCLGGHEWRGIQHNCEHNIPKSLGYAARTAFARCYGLFKNHVAQFICLTEFQRQIHVQEGFPAHRMSVIPNAAPDRTAISDVRGKGEDGQKGSYVGYAGRVSFEKDVPVLLAAARMLPDVSFKIAGDYWRMPHLPKEAPSNVEFLGHLQGREFEKFFVGMNLLVFATRFYEGFPMTLLDAMVRNVPIICTKIGGLPEIVEDDVTGLLYATSDATALVRQIRRLWGDQGLRETLAANALIKVRRLYSHEAVYRRTKEVYDRALEGS